MKWISDCYYTGSCRGESRWVSTQLDSGQNSDAAYMNTKKWQWKDYENYLWKQYTMLSNMYKLLKQDLFALETNLTVHSESNVLVLHNIFCI